jgi:uncharacterized protein (TIGR03435 family)
MWKQFLTATGVLALAAGAMMAQTPAVPAFEVASIKPVDMPTPAQIMSGKIHAGMKIDAARVDIGLTSLMELICKAYDVKPYQVQGPGWLNSQVTAQRFDIIAKMPDGATKEQVPQMLQSLLAERFKLAVHHETKEQAVYVLVAAKGGAKVKESAPLPSAPASEGGGPAAASSGSSEVTFKPSGRGGTVSDGEGMQQKVNVSPDGKIHLDFSGITMTKFVLGAITPFVDRPVVDETGLKGRYDISMELSMADAMAAARKAGAAVPANAPGAASASPDAARPADAASDSGTSSIFATLQTLGLKLEPRKVPIDLVVVDKAEKMPTDN